MTIVIAVFNNILQFFVSGNVCGEDIVSLQRLFLRKATRYSWNKAATSFKEICLYSISPTSAFEEGNPLQLE